MNAEYVVNCFNQTFETAYSRIFFALGTELILDDEQCTPQNTEGWQEEYV